MSWKNSQESLNNKAVILTGVNPVIVCLSMPGVYYLSYKSHLLCTRMATEHPDKRGAICLEIHHTMMFSNIWCNKGNIVIGYLTDM